MAGTNYILEFGRDSANILTQGEYDADAQRLIGHQPGIARSQLANKQARQAAYIAAAFAQWVADHQDDDVSDALAIELCVASIDAAITSGIPQASDTVQGKVELATTAEAIAGLDSERAVTPAALAAVTALTTRRGLVELATDTETITGTDSQRAVTPAALSARTATTTRTGVVELATTIEAAAGTDTERAVTPAGLAAALTPDQDLSSPGYTVLPGGFIMQWGSFTSTGNPAQTFPLEFPNACFGVQLSVQDETHHGVDSFSATGFQPDVGTAGKTCTWFAYGH